MKTPFIATLAALSANASATEKFEPADFNVTQALFDQGVNVSAIPDLVALSKNYTRYTPCKIACRSLDFLFEGKVLTTDQSDLYNAFRETYWSTQAAALQPDCVFKPSEAKDVAVAVLMSRLTECPFAVKGGGHTPWAGAASIEEGITISMEDMNEITYFKKKNTANIGPGARWKTVYEKLGEEERAVVGGRSADVGLGLVLGGGISHHSNIYGYACDNVASFQVVTASGAIVKASTEKHEDLYWALRGGGNNFGIVTRFELEAFPQILMWGGNRIHTASDYPKLMDAFISMAEDATMDPKSSQILMFSVEDGGESLAQVQLEYVEPVNEANPPRILKKYLDIPAMDVTTVNRTLADDSTILASQAPKGHRYTFWAATFKLDRDFMTWLQERHQTDVMSIPNVSAASLGFQAFTVPAMQQMAKNGGNALGISADDGPLMHIVNFVSWEAEYKDAEIQQASQNFINAAKTEAQNRGLDHDFIYLNYASPFQNVIPNYGAAKVKKLKYVANKYDPTGVFQTLQPGGHKLDGVPLEEE